MGMKEPRSHSYSPKGYHPQIKQFCLIMYLNGMGFRGIERFTGISDTKC